MLTGTAAKWIERLRAESVPVGPINNLQQVFADPHVQDHKMVVTVEHPVAGPVPLVANPIRLSETPIAYENPPPLLGQHTGDVLRNMLGLTDANIEELETQRIIQTSGR